ncbi:MAG TPA: DUF4062 domain-containing protein, partial [Psychrobacter sp.]|nr:DUF4062 domain-containing protein [Psychrobacter sp.]
LKGFIRMVEQKNNQVHYYDDNTDIKQLLHNIHADMIEKSNLAPEWIKVRDL